MVSRTHKNLDKLITLGCAWGSPSSQRHWGCPLEGWSWLHSGSRSCSSPGGSLCFWEGEELVWLSGKEHPRVTDDGQLGLLGHLQPWDLQFGKERMVPLSLPLFLMATEPGHPAFASGKISSVSICLSGSLSLVLWSQTVAY